jgi:hypothetical protein
MPTAIKTFLLNSNSVLDFHHHDVVGITGDDDDSRPV